MIKNYIIRAELSCQRQAIKGATPAQRDIGLAVREGAARQVQIDALQSHALTLVDRERPCEPHWKLLE
jgi:hypothetical protein